MLMPPSVLPWPAAPAAMPPHDRDRSAHPPAGTAGGAVIPVLPLDMRRAAAWSTADPAAVVARATRVATTDARTYGDGAADEATGGAAAAPADPFHDGSASAVVVTHNDGANLPLLLRRLLDEPEVAEVLVVASGCVDDTVAAVVDVARAEPRVQLFVEVERSGKMAAVNHGLLHASRDKVVVVSGDVLPEPGAVGLLAAALDAPGIGMAGGRPVPVNDPCSFLGHTVHLLWRVHHRLALHEPKVGEVAALRAEAARLLAPTAVDEAALQARVVRDGWQVAYVPEAAIRNRGPSTVRDFVRQRRRVNAGHLRLRAQWRYTVPSLRPQWLYREVLAEVATDVRAGRVLRLLRTAGAVTLEAWSRALAHLDHWRGEELHVWEMVASAKDPATGPDRRRVVAGRLVARAGLAAPPPRQRHDQRDLPVQLPVRDVQRLRAQGPRAHAAGVEAGRRVAGTRARVDDVQRR